MIGCLIQAGGGVGTGPEVETALTGGVCFASGKTRVVAEFERVDGKAEIKVSLLALIPQKWSGTRKASGFEDKNEDDYDPPPMAFSMLGVNLVKIGQSCVLYPIPPLTPPPPLVPSALRFFTE